MSNMLRSSLAALLVAMGGTVASSAAPVLDGSGIKIEFDSEERGFDCLSIKNKLGGKDVQFGDGVSDGSRAGLWAMKFWKDGSPSQTRWLTNHSPSSRSTPVVST